MDIMVITIFGGSWGVFLWWRKWEHDQVCSVRRLMGMHLDGFSGLLYKPRVNWTFKFSRFHKVLKGCRQTRRHHGGVG